MGREFDPLSRGRQLFFGVGFEAEPSRPAPAKKEPSEKVIEKIEEMSEKIGVLKQVDDSEHPSARVQVEPPEHSEGFPDLPEPEWLKDIAKRLRERE